MVNCTCGLICGFAQVFVLGLLVCGMMFGGLGFLFYIANLFDTGPKSRKGYDPSYSRMKKYEYTCKGWKNRVGNALKTAGCAILVIACIYVLYLILPRMFGV